MLDRLEAHIIFLTLYGSHRNLDLGWFRKVTGEVVASQSIVHIADNYGEVSTQRCCNAASLQEIEGYSIPLPPTQ